jgi:glycosidase
MIDRFATGENTFDFIKDKGYGEALRGWMGGDLKGVSRSLDYVAGLGADAFVLSPFFKGEKYHGYWITDYYMPDPHFGSMQDVNLLIFEAHRRGLRVLMDLPFTHCHVRAPAAADTLKKGPRSPYHDWFLRDNEGKLTGFFGDKELPEFDLDNRRVRDEIKRILDHWLPLGFDGIRFDHAKRPSRSFWGDISRYLKEHYPGVLLIGENWHENGEIGSLSSFLHGELNVPICYALRRFLSEPCNASLEDIFRCALEQRVLRQQGYLLPTYLDSHDLERASHEAHNRAETLKLAYLIQMTLPYPPVIYCGSERGQGQTDNLPVGDCERDRYFREPMDWTGGGEMLSWVRSLLRLRKRYIDFFYSEPHFTISEDGLGSYDYYAGEQRLSVAISCGETHSPVSVDRVPGMSLLSAANVQVSISPCASKKVTYPLL